MIKRILVTLDDSSYTDSAIQYAITIAKKHDATISGMTVLDILGIESSIGSVPVGSMYWAMKLENQRVYELRQKLLGIEANFIEQCSMNNVKYTLEEDKGIPSSWILKKAKFHDLVVMGLRTFYEYNEKNKEGKTVKEVLTHSEVPVLLVPTNYSEIKNVLIAYDGSMQATKAVHGFIHLARVSEFNIDIVNSSDDEKEAEFIRKNILEYFEAYKVKNVRFVHTDKNILDVLDNNEYEKNDLFVIGAHSKNAIKEFFTGSVTNYLINKNKKPVFIGL